MIGTRRDPIRTSKQLKTLYENAKKSRSGLTLVFKTPETIRHDDPSHVDKNWSHDGKWEGGGMGGWAGGAIDPWSKVSSIHITKSFSTTNTALTQSHLGSYDSTTLENKTSFPLPNDESDIDDIHHELMFDQSPSQRRRSVTLVPPAAFAIQPLSESGALKKASDTSNPTQLRRLLDAIHNNTCQDLINILESGASHDGEVVEKGLQECYNEVKAMISLTTKEGETETESKAMSDLNAKRKVLNLYINSTLLLEKALNLEHWGSFELRVLNADVRFPDNSNKASITNLVVFGSIKMGSLQAYGGKMENLVSPRFALNVVFLCAYL